MYFNLFRKILEFYKTAKISVEELKPLEKFITSEENPKFFFTMTEINKIGINPQSKYDTPIGIYSYPLTKEYYSKLITNTLPFAGDKQYINLFSISDKTNNLSNYNNLDYDIKFLEKHYEKEFKQIKDVAFYNSRKNTNVSKFWNLTRLLAKTPLKWNALFRQLGYTNFYDSGEGTIHPSEPTQCVIFDPRIIIPIETFLNPYYSAKDPYLQKPISNISEQDINNILKTKNKDTISRFDDFIFNSLKPYQMMYILNNNIIEKELVFETLKNNKYLQEDLNLLTFFLKNTLKLDKNLIDDIIDYAAQNTLEEVYNVYIIGDGLLVSDDKLIWYKNGKYHREDGPAVKYADGSKEWWLNDNLHRDGEPAVEKANGDKYWYKNGKRHREDGPAIEHADGTKKWFKNGKQHREDGPAIEYADGSIYWLLNDEYYGKNDDFTNKSWKEVVNTL